MSACWHHRNLLSHQRKWRRKRASIFEGICLEEIALTASRHSFDILATIDNLATIGWKVSAHMVQRTDFHLGLSCSFSSWVERARGSAPTRWATHRASLHSSRVIQLSRLGKSVLPMHPPLGGSASGQATTRRVQL